MAHTDPNRSVILRRLSFGGAAIAVFGLAFSLAAIAWPDLLVTLYALIGPDTATDMNAAARLGAGIYGGLSAGWGAMLFLLGREVRVERAAAIGLAVWYVVDSGSSIALGYPLNAVANLGFMALFVPVALAMAARRRPATTLA